MKDIDFDELDRAVNNLMSSKQAPAAADNVSKSNDTTSDDKPAIPFDQSAAFGQNTMPKEASQSDDNVVEASSDARGGEIEQISVSTSPVTSPLAVRRSGGRFMDVVHPSADMKAATSDRPVSRQGVSLEPFVVSPNPNSEERATEPDLSDIDLSSDTPNPLVKSATSVTAAEQKSFVSDIVAAPSTSEKPLLLEDGDDDGAEGAAHVSSLEDPTVTTDAAAINEIISTADNANELEASPVEPLTTPFLADAKVEKRPLGENNDQLMKSVPAEPTPNFMDLGASTQSSNQPTVLPEELQNDLISVEADTTSPHADRGDLQTEEIAETKTSSTDDLKEKALLLDTSKPVANMTEPNDQNVETGPVSIHQQYKEVPSVIETKSGNIYDVDNYHQPLQHPEHKKSGWLWIVWIILLIIGGAGGGAAVYYFLLQ